MSDHENAYENQAQVVPADLEKGFDQGGFTDAYISRLQNNVFAVSGMPCGDSYTHVLGSGDEPSNLDAIRTLILERLEMLNELPSSQHLEKMLEEIRNRFDTLHGMIEH